MITNLFGYCNVLMTEKSRRMQSMSACEKCWSDAYHRMLADPSKGQAEHYQDLIRERENDPCTPEEQRGESKESDT